MNMYKQGKITHDAFSLKLCPFLDLESLVIFFLTPYITKHIYFELINLNVTRGHTFKIKSSNSQALAPTCSALVVFDRVENIVGKGENAGYQHSLLFPQCFQKASSTGLFKVRIW